MKRMLFVVDMLEGFLNPDAPLYCGDQARLIIPAVMHKIAEYHSKGDPVVYICDRHKQNDVEFEMFPEHCVKGTREAELIPEIQDYKWSNDLFVYKTKFSPFYRNLDIQLYLDTTLPKVCEVVGVCTNICVMYTVADLRNREFAVEVPADCVASFDEVAHDFALDQMANVLGAIVKPIKVDSDG